MNCSGEISRFFIGRSSINGYFPIIRHLSLKLVSIPRWAQTKREKARPEVLKSSVLKWDIVVYCDKDSGVLTSELCKHFSQIPERVLKRELEKLRQEGALQKIEQPYSEKGKFVSFLGKKLWGSEETSYDHIYRKGVGILKGHNKDLQEDMIPLE